MVLDVAEVTFIDSSMLKELLRADAELARYETRLVLAGVPRAGARGCSTSRARRSCSPIARDRAEALELLGTT